MLFVHLRKCYRIVSHFSMAFHWHWWTVCVCVSFLFCFRIYLMCMLNDIHAQASKQASRQNFVSNSYIYVVVSAHGLCGYVCVPCTVWHGNTWYGEWWCYWWHFAYEYRQLNQSINLNPNAKWDEVCFEFCEEKKNQQKTKAKMLKKNFLYIYVVKTPATGKHKQKQKTKILNED